MSSEIPPQPDYPQNPQDQPSPAIPEPVPGDVPAPLASDQPTASPPRPWGFWATIGWGLLIFLAYILVNVAVLFLAMSLGAFGKPPHNVGELDAKSNGLMLVLSTLASTPVLCGLSLLFARLRRNMDVRTYLGLRWPGYKTLFRWCLGMAILLALSDTTTTLLGKSIVPEFMVKAYQTAGIIPLLWLAVIVAAPLGEEFLVRGFLFEGFRQSRLGGPGAIIATALFWAGLHLQYDLYGISSILVAGLFLGYARLRTGSVWLCVCLHALMNLIASVELLVYLR